MDRSASDAADLTEWQARKRASYEADERALRNGEKTREQLTEENSSVPAHVAQAPLSWDDVLW